MASASPAASSPEPAPAVSAPAAVPETVFKVFVGNLSFETKMDELADWFDQKCGGVVRANIITRGPRSLGYGFVEFDSEDAATKAVRMMDKTALGGRQINVELAKPSPAPSEKGEGAGHSGDAGSGDFVRGPRRRNFRNNNNNNNNFSGGGRFNNRRAGGVGGGAGGAGGVGGGAGGAGSFSGGQRYRQRRASGSGSPGPAASGPAAGGAAPSAPSGGYVPRNPRGPRRGPGGPRRGPGGDGSSPSGAGGFYRNSGPSAGGAPRAPRVERPKVQSTTTLFVANIPFSMDDSGLSSVFSKFSVKTAHVVRKPNGRSKGFGFVEFENEADQHAALAAVDKTVVDDRELSVKVALTPVEGGESSSSAPPAVEEKREEKTEASA